MRELGYRPDLRARDLAALRSGGRLLGFLQVDGANPFFAAVHRGLEDSTRAQGLVIIAGSTDAVPEREAALVETLIELRVDGLVVAAAEGSDALLRREIEHGTPVVCVDRILEQVPCDTVVSSNRASTRAAVHHLRTAGHRRIAFLGGDHRVWTAQERLAGYREAMADEDADEGPVVMDVGDVGRAAEATRRLLAAAAPPTAIFAAQDRITMGVITVLHELGRQHEVALFGFDEIPFAEQLAPSVSVVAQDPYEMGRRAGALMAERLVDPARPPVTEVVGTTLRHRRSGDIPPSHALAGPERAEDAPRP